jgi:hypothetical protein
MLEFQSSPVSTNSQPPDTMQSCLAVRDMQAAIFNPNHSTGGSFPTENSLTPVGFAFLAFSSELLLLSFLFGV